MDGTSLKKLLEDLHLRQEKHEQQHEQQQQQQYQQLQQDEQMAQQAERHLTPDTFLRQLDLLINSWLASRYADTDRRAFAGDK